MITINIDKAKSIAHDVRRAARAAEFEPLDNIIAKQIPGTAAQEAETQRQSIRDKYAVMQDAIDAAVTVDEIKAAMPQGATQ
jgi:hypothetical protein